MFNEVMAKQVHGGKIEAALDELYEENKTKYLDVFGKLAQYFLPKRVDVTSDDKEITGFIVKSVRDAERNNAE